MNVNAITGGYDLMHYEGSIWRPPSEARSLILQATVGCSHNACTFCVSYKQKQFRVRGAEAIRSDLNSLPNAYKQRVHRVFLADGDALAMNTNDLRQILQTLTEELPLLERVGLYGYAKNVRDKSVDDLRQLRESGLGIVYLGLETGDNELLQWVRKGVKTNENIAACKKIKDAGIPLSLTIILGLGGIEHSEKHAIATASALNTIDPEYVGALTLMLPEGTPLYKKYQQGTFKPMEPFDILKELHQLISELNLSKCVFRTNHASNYLPIRGTLNQDKTKMLATLENAIEVADQNILRPGYLRGL
jgi:radical SAM superfamily enzyme YgiQ (UPF0313 family)